MAEQTLSNQFLFHSFNKWNYRIHFGGLKAPNLYKKYAENARSYFLGFGVFLGCLGSFLGFVLSSFLVVVVVCGLLSGWFSVLVFMYLFAFKISLGFVYLIRAGFWGWLFFKWQQREITQCFLTRIKVFWQLLRTPEDREDPDLLLLSIHNLLPFSCFSNTVLQK